MAETYMQYAKQAQKPLLRKPSPSQAGMPTIHNYQAQLLASQTELQEHDGRKSKAQDLNEKLLIGISIERARHRGGPGQSPRRAELSPSSSVEMYNLYSNMTSNQASESQLTSKALPLSPSFGADSRGGSQVHGVRNFTFNRDPSIQNFDIDSTRQQTQLEYDGQLSGQYQNSRNHAHTLQASRRQSEMPSSQLSFVNLPQISQQKMQLENIINDVTGDALIAKNKYSAFNKNFRKNSHTSTITGSSTFNAPKIASALNQNSGGGSKLSNYTTTPSRQMLNSTVTAAPGVFGNKKLSTNPNMNASLMQKIISRDFPGASANHDTIYDKASEVHNMLATVLMQTTNFNEKYKDDAKYLTITKSEYTNNTQPGPFASGQYGIQPDSTDQNEFKVLNEMGTAFTKMKQSRTKFGASRQSSMAPEEQEWKEQVYHGERRQDQFDKIKMMLMTDMKGEYRRAPKVHRRARTQLKHTNVTEMVINKSPVGPRFDRRESATSMQKGPMELGSRVLVYGSPRPEQKEEQTIDLASPKTNVLPLSPIRNPHPQRQERKRTKQMKAKIDAPTVESPKATPNWQEGLRTVQPKAKLKNMIQESNVILRKKRQKSKDEEREREEEEQPGQKLNKVFSFEDIHKEEFKDYNKKEFAKKLEKTRNKFANEFANDEKMVSLILINDELAQLNPQLVESKWQRIKADTKGDQLETYLSQLIQPKGNSFAGKSKMAKQPSVLSNPLLARVKSTFEKKKLAVVFDKYVEEHTDALRSIGQRLRDTLRYNEIFKTAHLQSTSDRFRDDPRLVYFKQCNDVDKELVLPVLDHVYDKTLCLQSYTLSIGHCNALAKAFEYFSGFINRVILDNCGVDDQEFAAILRGIKKLRDFKKIVYRNNVFHENSLREMQGCLERKIPNHIEELRIENCQIDQKMTRELLRQFNGNCYLKRFGLVNAGMKDDMMDSLCEFVTDSSYLEEVDVSYNRLSPLSFYKLMNVLATNDQLMYINLSWNFLRDQHQEENKKLRYSEIERRQLESIDDYSSIRKTHPDSYYEPFEYEKDRLDVFKAKLDENSKSIMTNLCKFIARNKNLIHADFSHTGLNEKMLWYFGRTMRRTHSLRSLHLSGNPGISKRLKQYLHKRAHCADKVEPNVIDMNLLPSNAKHVHHVPEDIDKKHADTTLLKLIKKYKQIEQSPAIESKNQHFHNHQSETLIFTRYLGHKEEIPGACQWKMIDEANEDCWICDREVYTLIFWSPEIGRFEMRKVPGSDQEFLIKNIDGFNPHRKVEEREKVPYIYGQFTNWKPKRMYEIREYCYRIDHSKPNIFEKCKGFGYFRSEVDKFEDLDEEELRKYQNQMKKHLDTYSNRWKDVIQDYLKYQKPNLVNAASLNMVSLTSSNLYVYATFMKSGKQFYCVETKEPAKMYVHSTISKFRNEEIMAYKKNFKHQVVVRRFRRDISVFARWKEDEPLTIKQCLDHDFYFWKCPRFIKDINELRNLEKSVKKHFLYLKNTHIVNACGSTFPACSINEFSAFSRRCQFTDRNLPQSTIDRLFIQANVELEDQRANPDKQLFRFEFIELLVRIANDKYLRHGKTDTITEAFEKLIEENVKQGSMAEQWQGFRDNFLWKVEVNDVLDANLDLLRKIYKSYLSPVHTLMSLEDILDLFLKKADLGLLDKDVIFFFGMSKMTVAHENDHVKDYSNVLFVEFLEVIGRCADHKFTGSELEDIDLAQKINFVLDDLFAPFHMRRRNPRVEIEEETESDSDY